MTVGFLVYIDYTYQNERYDDHDVARHGESGLRKVWTLGLGGEPSPIQPGPV